MRKASPAHTIDMTTQINAGGSRKSAKRGTARAAMRAAVIETLEQRQLLSIAPVSLISFDTTGTVSANGASDTFNGPHVAHNQLSNDGRWVVFESDARNLVSVGTAGTNVYVRDRANNKTTLVSVNASGQGAGGNSASITQDGKFVVFISSAVLTAGDANAAPDVYVFNVATGKNTLVSVDTSGAAVGVDGNVLPVISDNGQFVAYASAAGADTIVAGDTDTNGADDVFVRDLTGGTTALVSESTTTAGATGDAASINPSISADGKFIAFQSDASDLGSVNDSNGVTDVFLRDTQTATTLTVSVNGSGTSTGNFASGSPQVTSQGNFVAFLSRAGDITNGDGGVNNTDLFLFDISTGANTLASSNVAGAGQTGDVSVYSVTPDGQFAAFASNASGFGGSKVDLQFPVNVFRKNIKTGALDVVSVPGTIGTTVGGGSNNTRSVSISDDGRFIAWDSTGTNVAPGFNSQKTISNVYLRDMTSSFSSPVSIAQGLPLQQANGNSAFVSLSGDDSTIIFDSDASNLTGTGVDNNAVNGVPVTDVFFAVNIIPDATPPTATLTQALDIPSVTASPEVIIVTYADDVAIRTSTLDSKDIRVTGPNGFSQLATFISVDQTINGTPRIGTYQLPPPNGVSWTLADRGIYTVLVVPGQVTDTSGKPIVGGVIGTFRVTLGSSDFTNPTAFLAAANVTTSGAASYTFKVTYQDNVAVDISTFDNSDLLVTSTLGFSQAATFVSATRTTNGTPVTATYTITPPGGAWDIFDNGVYTVSMQNRQVKDTSGNSVATGPLGTFTVATGTTGLGFSTTAFSVSEGAGTAVITVNRTGDTAGVVTVDYAAAAGTAVANQNFTPVMGTLTFGDGQTTATFNVPVLDDTAIGGPLTVNLTLSNPSGQLAFVAQPSTAVLTIQDNDSTVEFSAPSVSVRRDAGSVAITITRNGATDNPATVIYTTTDGTALAGRDYTSSSDVLTFLAGQKSKTFVIPILADVNVLQPTVAFTISLTNVSGFNTLPAAPSTMTVTIAGGPRITAVHLLSAQGRVDRVERVALQFDTALNPATTGELGNYILTQKNSTDGRFNSRVRLSDAIYDPATMTVFLFPTKPLVANRMYQLSLNTLGTLSDTGGNKVVSGTPGDAGGRFVAFIGRGTTLNYTDRSSNNVSLQLRRGGMMELISGLSGADPVLNIISRVAGNTTLSGNVKKGKHGTGVTSIATINGAVGVIDRLTNPPFSVGTVNQ